MSETHLVTTESISVQRTALVATLGSLAENPRELWYVLHGYGGSAKEFIGDFTAIDDGAHVIVAPEALSRFYTEDIATRVRNKNANAKVGASWMTKEQRDEEIEDYIAYLDIVHRNMSAHYGRSGAVKITVLGFSQGAATASRWVASGGVNADRLVIWGSSIAPELDIEKSGSALRKPETVIVVGEKDIFATPKIVEKELARLREANFPFRFVSFAGGHRMDDDTLRALAAQ